MRKAVFAFTLSFLTTYCALAQPTARTIVDDMVYAIDHAITVSGRIKRSERVKGHLMNGELTFKLMTKPYKIYVYNYLPDVGAELLLVKGWNDDKVLVHPNKFPWINLSFIPHSTQLTNSGHHPLTSIGFGYTNSIVKHLLATRADQFDKIVKYDGRQTWYGKSLHVLKIHYADYGFTNYTVQGTEDIFDIDEKLKVPAYKIVEINGLKNFLDIVPGQVIKVPNCYAKEMVLMIDPDSHLPIVQLTYDDKGLFEKYEFSDLKINIRFTTLDFLEENEDYGF